MRVKICGLFRPEDADYVNEFMPDFAGFVFYPKSHRFLDDAAAAQLRKLINSAIKTVGVFVNDSQKHIAALYTDGVIDVIQLHGSEDEEYIASLRQILPDAEIWQAFVIHDESDMSAARKSSADMVLLDNGKGTGARFDWSLAGKPGREFILAGGLNEKNIEEAAKALSPAIADISSGAETNGVKDREKIKAIIEKARRISG